MFALSIKNRRDDMIRRQAAKKLSSQSKRSTSTAINRPHAAVPVSTPPAINRSNSDNQLIFQNDDEMRTPAVLQTVGGRKSISVAGPQYTPKIDQLDLELIEISKKSTTIEHEKPKVIRRRATIHNYSPFLCLFRGRKKSKSRRKVASTNDKNALNNDQTFYSARENFSSNNEYGVDNLLQEIPPRLKQILRILTLNQQMIRTISRRKIRLFLHVSLGNFTIAKIPNKLYAQNILKRKIRKKEKIICMSTEIS
uniref:Uncharacterized protein n=1 Tax=Romanomermis culicivorax TaxID=13658 RepID=A0A915HVM1_ROMCU